MSGCIWKFSQYLDDEDIMFAHKIFVSYRAAGEYYGIGEKPMTRMAWESGAVYKIGKKVLIKREIFEEYLRQHYKQVDELIEGDEAKLIKQFEKKAKEADENG